MSKNGDFENICFFKKELKIGDHVCVWDINNNNPFCKQVKCDVDNRYNVKKDKDFEDIVKTGLVSVPCITKKDCEDNCIKSHNLGDKGFP